jgi:hypothetical protein
MAGEYDRKFIPEIFQQALEISLGATYKGFEMMKTPKDSFDRMQREATSLVTIPDDAGGKGVQEKFKALAAVWMEKGTSLMNECLSAGAKFVEDENKDDEPNE